MRAVLILAMFIGFVAAVIPRGEAIAGFLSGQDLLDACSPQKADPVYRLKVAECRGYVIGVADTFDCKRERSGFKWASDVHVSQRDLVNIVITWYR